MKVILLVITITMMLSGMASAQSLDLMITNNTKLDMEELFIMSEEQMLSENLVVNKGLGSRASTGVTYTLFDPASTSWDIIAYDKEGNCLFWRGLNLVNVKQIILKAENGIVNSELVKDEHPDKKQSL